MDVNFGGLLTNLKQKLMDHKLEDLAFSMQETVFAMLTEISERALAHTEKKELVLGGGVACNKRLQEMCRIMCQERGAKYFCPDNQFLVDNGAMIAWLGILMYKKGITVSVEKSAIDPYERTDDVLVKWR
jgi:N6-L-threonylcarbamoyladenine synthase